VQTAISDLSRGPNVALASAGNSPRVRSPHSSQHSSCSRNSVTTGRIGGTSITCVRRGSASRPFSRALHRRQRIGTHSTTLLTCSGGSNSRLWCLWPGCPPRLRSLRSPSRLGAPGGSDDGGFDELLEFCRNLATSASSSATRASNFVTNALRSAISRSRGSLVGTTTVDHRLIPVSIPER
jgi:hypothetical protein